MIVERALTQKEWKLAADSINNKVRDPDDPCPLCGGQNEILPTITEVNLGIEPSGGFASLPCLTTVCIQCGLLRQFSAKLHGIDSENPDA